MKKRLLLAAVGMILCLTASSFSQLSKQLGVTAGMSMYSATQKEGSSTTNFDSKTSIVAGAVFDISLLNIVSIEPGLVYSTRNSSYRMITTPFHSSRTIENDFAYLAVPIHAKVRWPGMPVFKPYVLAGVNVGFLLSASSPGADTTDIKSQCNNLDFGFDFGGGLEFDLPFIVPYIEYVYDLGMSNIIKNLTSNESFKLNGSEIKAGIRFKL
jgi:opacity protein-like surface antigen